MHLDKQGYVSIVELIVYIPSLVLGVIVCFRHGFKRTSGWLFIVILSVIRIAGAVCQLLTLNNPTEGLVKASLILDSIGIAPLLLMVLGILSRLVDWINDSLHSPKFNPKLFRVLQMVTGMGLILGIIGVTRGGSWAANGTFVPPTVSKVGIILYIVVLAALIVIFLLSLLNVSAVSRRERLLLVHIPFALLAIFIRLLYAALAIFVHNNTFSLFDGSIVADILMAVVEEFFVVAITIALGFKLSKIGNSVQDENNGEQAPGSKNGGYAFSTPLDASSSA